MQDCEKSYSDDVRVDPAGMNGYSSDDWVGVSRDKLSGRLFSPVVACVSLQVAAVTRHVLCMAKNDYA